MYRLGDMLGDLEIEVGLEDPEGTMMLSAFVIVKRIAPEWDRPKIAYVCGGGLGFDEQIGMLRDVLNKVEHDSLEAWED